MSTFGVRNKAKPTKGNGGRLGVTGGATQDSSSAKTEYSTMAKPPPDVFSPTALGLFTFVDRNVERRGRSLVFNHINEPSDAAALDEGIKLVFVAKVPGFGEQRGVFAKENIKDRTLISEYVGLIERQQENPNEGGDYCMNCPTIGDGVVINAEIYGNVSRFYNHSNNANMITHVVDGKHLFVITGRDVVQGEQLTIDYGENYFKGEEPSNELGDVRWPADRPMVPS